MFKDNIGMTEELHAELVECLPPITPQEFIEKVLPKMDDQMLAKLMDYGFKLLNESK